MADPSPEIAAQLHSLESSYGDNPGRYFVPYAGLLREAGQPERAEEILRENLKRFPGLSAHVLLGRCLADRGAHQEASNEFHYVLSIDSQNLIALRTLAEMAASDGRSDEARRWYDELLSVDPMNADARAALARLARSGADASTADQPAGSGEGWGGAGEGAGVAGTAAAAEPSYDEEWGNLDLGGDTGEPGSEAEPAAEFDAFGFGEVALDGDGAPAPEDEPRQDTGAAGIDLPLLDFAPEGDDEEEDAPPAAGDLSGEPEVVTETMAELYASQGLRERAAEVYRELIQRRGEEPGLLRRLAALESAGEPAGAEPEPEAAPEWLLRVDEGASGNGEDPDDLPDLGLLGTLPELDFDGEEDAESPPAAADADEDSFAASVSEGFGAGPEAAAAPAEEPDRAAWTAPELTETEASGGFDLLVIDDSAPLDGDAHPPASAEEAADLSADWAVAAAPLEEQEDGVEDAVHAASGQQSAAPQPEHRRTMRGYFASLLSWSPGAEPVAEVEEFAPAAEEPWAAAEEETREPAAVDGEPWYEPAEEEEEEEALASDSPDASTADASASGASDAGVEEPLPWELPAAAPAEAGAGVEDAPEAESGFSFEDFFGAGPAAQEPEPPPAPAAAAPQPAPAPPAASTGGTEAAGGAAAGDEDEDLESFQAWLQSLKR